MGIEKPAGTNILESMIDLTRHHNLVLAVAEANERGVDPADIVDAVGLFFQYWKQGNARSCEQTIAWIEDQEST